jgi:formylglycine-generating enzyme required for sulfatase activity
VTCVAGCSLVLEDPAEFQTFKSDIFGGDEDAGPRDASRPPLDVFQGIVDAGPRDAAPTPTLDAAVVEVDGAVEVDDAAVDAAATPTGDAGPDASPPDAGCVPVEEVCDGVDNDCDERVDEEDRRVCSLCGPPGQQGVCAQGGFLCIEGALRCVPWLPDEGSAFACDLLDNDCDGALDESGESAPAREGDQVALVAACGARPIPPVTALDEDDGCGEDPRVVGCGVVHACLDPGCLTNCQDDLDTVLPRCDGGCEQGDPASRALCIESCRSLALESWRNCLGRCGMAFDHPADRFVCSPTAGGPPKCVPQACPDGFRIEGRDCAPNAEICNNGLDDDDDGLVDGTLDGDDPCMATIDATGEVRQRGVCAPEDRGLPGCEDTDRLESPFGGDSPSRCSGDACPNLVDTRYRFALDREEVSIRAYMECVDSGCCPPPAGQVWRRAVELVEAQGKPPRPEDPDRCAPLVGSLDELAEPLDALDLPVSGVSWCEARNYCNWVGKRLPTEWEWEVAATGTTGERRSFPWGDAPPPGCMEEQCCRSADYDGPVPPACGDVDSLHVCPEAPPQTTRRACMATYNAALVGCQLRGELPAPVYANRDGATPEGLLNMGGNIGEWVFDWFSQGWDANSTVDPIGTGCDTTGLQGARSFKGEWFTGEQRRLRGWNRRGIYPSSRLSVLGFRCGRTIEEGADVVCDSGMPSVPARCLPGASIVDGVDGVAPQIECAGPDFEDASHAPELAVCEGGAREQTPICQGGLEDFCATDRVLGCHGFVMSKLELLAAGFGEGTSAEVVGLINSLFSDSLAPNGGDTLYHITPNSADFSLIPQTWPARFGSAIIDRDGRLVQLGIEQDGVCTPSRTATIDLETRRGNPDLAPICGVEAGSQLWVREMPLSIPFSAVAMSTTYTEAAGRISGTLTLVVTVNDLRRATFGGPDQSGEEYLQNFGFDTVDLCFQPVGVVADLSCFQEPLVLPGCDFQTRSCMNPDTCTGTALPFRYEAIRADRLDLPGLDCAPPEE